MDFILNVVLPLIGLVIYFIMLGALGYGIFKAFETQKGRLILLANASVITAAVVLYVM